MRKLILASIIIFLVSFNIWLGRELLHIMFSASAESAVSNVTYATYGNAAGNNKSAANVPVTLGMTTPEFIQTFNGIAAKLNYPSLTIKDVAVQKGELQDTATYMFSKDLGLLLTVNKKDQSVRDASVYASGTNAQADTEFRVSIGIIVEATNPQLPPERRNEVLADFRVIGADPTMDVTKIDEVSTKNGVKYHLTNMPGYSLMFNASSEADVANEFKKPSAPGMPSEAKLQALLTSLNQTSLTQGKMMDVAYPLGSPYAAVKQQWGATPPVKKIAVEGRPGYYYEPCSCAFFVGKQDTITGIKKYVSISIQDVIHSLGAPTTEGWNPEWGGYEMAYELPGNKQLRVNVDNPDQTGYAAQAKPDPLLKITDMDLIQK